MKFVLFSTVLIFFLTFQLFADPWGKDADLCHLTKQIAEKTCPTPILGKVAQKLIAFHQNVISPADGPRSHFLPSSSQYTLDAMHAYGFFTGFVMGCDRLMRENSEEWVYPKTVDASGATLKHDPIPK